MRLTELAQTEIEQVPKDRPTLLSLEAIGGVGKDKKRVLIDTCEAKIRPSLATHSLSHRILVRGRY
jgi:hypothetical protein